MCIFPRIYVTSGLTTCRHCQQKEVGLKGRIHDVQYYDTYSCARWFALATTPTPTQKALAKVSVQRRAEAL